MSILDPIQKTLATDVWDVSGKMFTPIKEQILQGLNKFLDPVNIKEIYIVGTITGYQYTATSDIDCNVVVDPPELINSQDIKRHRKSSDGTLAKGTLHPINYFLVPWKGEASFWGDFKFGVYNLLTDEWSASPGNSEDQKDPALEYGMEINLAKMYIRKFQGLVDTWKNDIKELDCINNNSDKVWYELSLKRKKEELKKDFMELLTFCHDIDRDRKLEYGLNWGIPRKNWRNVLFKAIEQTELEEYFHFFKELKVDDYYTSFYKIVREIPKDRVSIIGYRANRQKNVLLPDIK